ncbi:MAG: hypothetical protein K2L42_03520 [Clostridia bacterium]|nr:hypothetical protein [Clostridia bacterium]
MDNKNVKETKIRATAENTAEAETNGAAAGLGKFQSVDALYSAYQALEAEFTRRSQRLKELEEGNKAQNDAPSRGELKGEELLRAALSDESVKEAVISEYVKELSANRSVPLITGGVSPAAPRTPLKSVKEAGALAQRFLKN